MILYPTIVFTTFFVKMIRKRTITYQQVTYSFPTVLTFKPNSNSNKNTAQIAVRAAFELACKVENIMHALTIENTPSSQVNWNYFLAINLAEPGWPMLPAKPDKS